MKEEDLNKTLHLILDTLVRIEKRLDSLEARVDSLEKRMHSLEKRMGALEERVDALERRMGVLEERVGLIEVHLDALDKKVDILSLRTDVRFNQLESKLDTQTASFSEIISDLAIHIDTSIQASGHRMQMTFVKVESINPLMLQ